LSTIRKHPVSAFKFGDAELQLYAIGNSLYTDVELYNGPLAPPVEVKRGEFTIRRPGWDRNSDRGAFEVVNENDVPIFQMIYITPGDIVIKGILVFKSLVFVSDDNGGVMNPPPSFSYRLSRIFKYPSSLHPAERQ
jgi:hypothetical protein